MYPWYQAMKMSEREGVQAYLPEQMKLKLASCLVPRLRTMLKKL